MKRSIISLSIIGLLGTLLNCQPSDGNVVEQQSLSKKSNKGARWVSSAGVSFDITAQNPTLPSGNCRQFYAPQSAGFKTLVTVSVNNFNGGNKTFAIQGFQACGGCNCSSYQAVSLSSGYNTSLSNGWLWTVTSSGSHQMTFYVTMNGGGACESIWNVGLQSPQSIPANGCSDGTGDAINIIKHYE